jgi:hypothetical protein
MAGDGFLDCFFLVVLVVLPLSLPFAIWYITSPFLVVFQVDSVIAVDFAATTVEASAAVVAVASAPESKVFD